MARLRSASVANTPRKSPMPDLVTPGRVKPTLPPITEPSTNLNNIIERQSTPDCHSPQHLDSVLDSFKNTPSSLPSGPGDQLYPSLDSVLEKNSESTPRMPKSRIPAATGKKGKATKAEPMTPMKKGATFEVPEGEGGFGFNFPSGLAMQGRKLLKGLTGKKAPAAPAITSPTTPSPKKTRQGDFPEIATPRGSQTEPRPLRKTRRFSDIHRQQFAKMDSIATHYAAKRTTPNPPKATDPPSDITPKNAVLTPEMAPKGIKRTKSQAVLSEREVPVSPSPVKMQQPRLPDGDTREEDPSPVKRQKLDPTQATLKKKPTKIARLTSGTPMKSMSGRHAGVPNTVAAGALGRGMFLKAPSSTRKMPALPKPIGKLNLTPATTLSATPSKIPTTPGKALSLRSIRNAPATVGGSKLNTMINFAEAVSSDSNTSTGSYELPPNPSTPAKSAPKPSSPPPTTVGGFTFRSRGSGLGFGALSEIHKRKMEMPKFPGGMGTPKVSENDPVGVEDPFASVMEEKRSWEEKSKDIAWAVGAPSAAGRKSEKSSKRKETHPSDESEEGEEGHQGEEAKQQQEVKKQENEREKSSAPKPARKKLRFDTASGHEEKAPSPPAPTPPAPTPATDLEAEKEGADQKAQEKNPPQTLAHAVAKANRKRRLNFLAAPKKRIAGEGDKLGRRSTWK